MDISVATASAIILWYTFWVFYIVIPIPLRLTVEEVSYRFTSIIPYIYILTDGSHILCNESDNVIMMKSFLSFVVGYYIFDTLISTLYIQFKINLIHNILVIIGLSYVTTMDYMVSDVTLLMVIYSIPYIVENIFRLSIEYGGSNIIHYIAAMFFSRIIFRVLWLCYYMIWYIIPKQLDHLETTGPYVFVVTAGIIAINLYLFYHMRYFVRK